MSNSGLMLLLVFVALSVLYIMVTTLVMSNIKKSREIKELVSKIVETYHPIKRNDLDKVTIDEGYKHELEKTRSIHQIVNHDDQ